MKDLFIQAGWKSTNEQKTQLINQSVTEQSSRQEQTHRQMQAASRPKARTGSIVPAKRKQRHPSRSETTKADTPIVRVQQQSRELPLKHIRLDDSLPVAQRADEIIALIQQHQVVVLAGETGSGKTTQLPKLAMLAGRGQFGRIALTQPRRLAARSVANRIAEELDSTLGEYVGVKVRFHQQVGQQTAIKVLTDGMLLAEVAGDARLSEYDTIIVDEAHERSLNIDFLLGYLRQLIDQRPDLKVIVTSATIDLQRFSDFFKQAPIIQVSGRSFPVETRYRPLTELALNDDDEVDVHVAIVRAVAELTQLDPFGDILVFLPGEADIREAAEVLRQEGLPHTDILPLYARQSYADQQRIFTTGGARRIVLSTNVAETSLTVPGIRHVVDTGLARIKRYSVRNKVQRLPIEAISQASANQRQGRCGRVAAGVCIRLYSEEDFLARLAFTEPEMQRSNLASVMLQMQALGLGCIDDFPLIDPPAGKNINDGYRLLEELQAVDVRGRLTGLGRQLAKLPLDPRLARMLVAAHEQGLLAETAVLAAVLSLQDPRETPADKQQAAREKHRLFVDERSDFITLLNLWLHYQQQRQHLSKNKLKNWCQKHYLSHRRMREWQEMLGQLQQSMADLKWKLNRLPSLQNAPAASPVECANAAAVFSDAMVAQLHQILLTGLLGQIAQRDEAQRVYTGARGVQLHIHPSSALAKRKAKWIMAFEWLETSRTWARLVAEIDVAWLERLARHLLKSQVAEPYWSKKQGRVLAKETLTLYGLVIAAERPTDYGKYDAQAARIIFVREGLVAGQIHARWPFLQHNQQLIDEALDWEDKTRRSDVLVDDDALAAFYLQRLPEKVSRTMDLQRWLNDDEQRMADLQMCRDDVFRKQLDTAQDFPDQLRLQNKLSLPIRYQFEPGQQDDGMTIQVRLSQLALLTEASLARLVPGLLPQKIELMIRRLPKSERIHLQPAAQQAQVAAEALLQQDAQLDFNVAVAQQLSRQAAVLISESHWRDMDYPLHLQPQILLLSDKGKKVLAKSRQLNQLQADFAEQAGDALRQATAARQSSQSTELEATEWQWTHLPEHRQVSGGGVAYVALAVGNQGVKITALGNREEAQQIHAAGVRHLLTLQLATTLNGIRKQWLKESALCLPWARWQRSCADLVEQLIQRALIDLSTHASQVRTDQAFDDLMTTVRPKITGLVREHALHVQQVIRAAQVVLADADRLQSPTRQVSLQHLRDFIAARLTTTFAQEASAHEWRQLSRYIKAAAYRLEKISENLPLDERRMHDYAEVEQLLTQANTQGLARYDQSTYERMQLMSVELWVMTFAQPFALKGSASLKQMRSLLA